jgi:hypothetical protein
MAVTAQGFCPLPINRAEDGLAAWLIQPTISDADLCGAGSGFPAGPGLSAVDMAAACLCLAEPVWDTDTIRPVARPVS